MSLVAPGHEQCSICLAPAECPSCSASSNNYCAACESHDRALADWHAASAIRAELADRERKKQEKPA